jgi:hypothetical protein
MNEAEKHPMFPGFKKYAEEQGIDLTYPDDWMPWWDCYLRGVMDSAYIMAEAMRTGFTVTMGPDEKIPH